MTYHLKKEVIDDSKRLPTNDIAHAFTEPFETEMQNLYFSRYLLSARGTCHII